MDTLKTTQPRFSAFFCRYDPDRGRNPNYCGRLDSSPATGARAVGLRGTAGRSADGQKPPGEERQETEQHPPRAGTDSERSQAAACPEASPRRDPSERAPVRGSERRARAPPASWSAPPAAEGRAGPRRRSCRPRPGGPDPSGSCVSGDPPWRPALPQPCRAATPTPPGPSSPPGETHQPPSFPGPSSGFHRSRRSPRYLLTTPLVPCLHCARPLPTGNGNQHARPPSGLPLVGAQVSRETGLADPGRRNRAEKRAGKRRPSEP